MAIPQVCCSGHGKNGALCILRQSIRPEMITEVCLILESASAENFGFYNGSIIFYSLVDNIILFNTWPDGLVVSQ